MWLSKVVARTWPLRRWLALRFVLVAALPLIAVAGLVWLVLAPQLRTDIEHRHQVLARAVAGQVETYLTGAQRQLGAVADLVRGLGYRPTPYWFGLLDAHVSTGASFEAIYLVDAADSVHSVGLPESQRGRREDLIGLDLSQRDFLRQARAHHTAIWSETFLSAVTGRLAVALAVPVMEQVIIGEIAIEPLSAFIDRLPGESGRLTLLDHHGQIVADSRQALSGQQLNLSYLPIVSDALRGHFAIHNFEFGNEAVIGTTVEVPQTGWIVLVTQPRRQALQQIVITLWVMAVGAGIALLLAIAAGWTLARDLSRRFDRYTDLAHAVAHGDYDRSCPPSHIAEFTDLANDLQRMSLAIREREQALVTSETRFRDLSTMASDWFWEQDEQFRFTSFSSGLAQAHLIFAEMLGKTRWELSTSLRSEQWAVHRAVLEAHQPFRDFEYCYTDPSGEHWINVNGQPLFNETGHFVGYRGTGRDITERKRMEEELASRIIALTRPLDEGDGIEFAELFNLEDIQTLQDLFAQATGVASIITHTDGVPITRPSNFRRLCDSLIRCTAKGLKNCYQSDAIIGRNNPAGPTVQPCLSGGLWDAGASITVGGRHIANWLIGQVRDQTQDDKKMLEYAREIGIDEKDFLAAFNEVPTMPREQFERVAQALFALAKQLSTLAYQNVQQARFITERQRTEQRIEHLAYYDALTNLPNRMLLAQRAELALAMAARQRTGLAVLFLDLDRFKDVNDSLGHAEGDALLIQVAARLQEQTRETDTVCRLGGDEFVLLLPDTNQEGALQVADKVLMAFRQPFPLAGHHLRVTVSVGIALYPHDGQNVNDLLKNADAALYQAKQDGRNTRSFYASEMNVATFERLVLESELRKAIAAGQLRAYYQLKIRLSDSQVVGAEALVRWLHPDHGLIPPGRFIPLAEASDLIVELGDWMLEEVCRQLAAWRSVRLLPLTIAVNLAARHFRDAGLVVRIQGLLTAHNLPPQTLELELTESSLLEAGPQTVETLLALERLGVGLAIDDFGTGYSSLSYLKRLPLTALKIDQSFVRDLVTDSDDRILAATIVALGHSLGLKVVAEGVETDEQRRILLDQGCDLAQGYFFGRPVPAEEFSAGLRREGTFGTD
ncbi:MAG: EAL domain-containing protein [Candidatus Competibacteraceae bacterium]|nr:EAL domain-containing protein [Candidatus Competibacteraceae bacterium]